VAVVTIEENKAIYGRLVLHCPLLLPENHKIIGELANLTTKIITLL
jgi:hypothetical protein